MEPLTADQLLAQLEALGIETRTHHHPPVFTVAESKDLRGKLPGGHCKSLFLRDRKKSLWLLVALEDRAVDLKWLRGPLGARGGLSFGAPELLMEVLGVIPGAVTPFAAVNDREHRVSVVLDKAMLDHDVLNYHPLSNDMTTAIAPADLVRFLEATGHAPAFLDFEAADAA